MYIRKRPVAVRVLALLLIVAFITPLHVQASDTRASSFISSVSASTSASGAGKVRVDFTVRATDTMDDIGATTIYIYESTDNINWTLKQTCSNGSYPRMLGHDVATYTGHVDYQGISGRYYKAYVCVYAGKDGSGDSRCYWTNSVVA